jgi:galactose oxidase
MRITRCVSAALCAFASCGAVLTIPWLEAQALPIGQVVVLINRNSGQCITNTGSTQVGLQLSQLTCHGPRSEQWILRAVTGGYKIFSKTNNNLCITVAGASTASGASIQQWTCNGGGNQIWTVRTSGSWLQLVSVRSKKCIAVSGASRDDGTLLIQSTCANVDEQRWTISAAPLPSAWSKVVTFPIVPAAAANMSDGRLVLWSAYLEQAWGGDHHQTYTVIYNPATGQQSEMLVSNTGHDMFCPGTAVLADGRILVNGGSSDNKTSIFDPASGIWSTSNVMKIPRGYEGDTLLTTGEVLTLGGSFSGGTGGKNAEVWASGNGWRLLPGVPIDPFIGPDPAGVYRGDNHLWLIAQSNGWVFQAGPAAAMHWIDTKNTGAVSDAGPRGDDVWAVNGNAVLYDVGKILKVGGAPAYQTGNASDSAYTIDISGGPTAPVTVTKLAPMLFPRAMASSVVLPNGQVVIVSGMNVSQIYTDQGAVLMAEMWDPQSETFTRLAPMKTPRTYHSEALLLVDGRIFVGGGGLCNLAQGTCPDNHPDAEILTPPYLLNSNGTAAVRPVITAAPGTAGLGSTITVTTDSDVTDFDLIRMAAATHSVNNDQRRIPLSIASGDPVLGYVLPIPADPGIVLPGNYMLFALNASGRPSVAKVIQIR